MTDAPKLSVVVTTYNRAEPLGWTLQSLAEQTRIPDELVVSDNASEDGTAEVVGSFRDKFPKLIYNRNEQNIGMPGNLNAGIQKCTGTYVANLHDADTFEPDLLEKWERALDQNPDAGFVFCGIRSVGRDPAKNRVRLHPCEAYTPGKDFFRKYFLDNHGSMVRGTVMMRREVYERLGLFDERWGIEADVDMWMRVCSQYGVSYVREPLQKCSSDHINRTFAGRRFLNYWAMVDWNLERVLPENQADWPQMRRGIRAKRRRRLLYLSATQVKRLNFIWAARLAYWALHPVLNPLVSDDHR
ncbi:MAG: glycosyltransferase family 2 protein [Kiritimatiellia bacterium]